MKKLFAVLVIIILLAGCGAQGVLQEDYDALAVEKDAAMSEKDSAISDLTNAQNEISTLKEDIQSLKEQLAALEEEASKATTGGLSDDGILIHEDEYVEVFYLGCELDRYDSGEMVFLAVNRTEVELTFQGSTLAIDGVSLGYVSGSDSIAAQSMGKIRYSTKEEFPTLSPTTITGTLRVVDFSKTLIARSYDFSFTNVEV